MDRVTGDATLHLREEFESRQPERGFALWAGELHRFWHWLGLRPLWFRHGLGFSAVTAQRFWDRQFSFYCGVVVRGSAPRIPPPLTNRKPLSPVLPCMHNACVEFRVL